MRKLTLLDSIARCRAVLGEKAQVATVEVWVDINGWGKIKGEVKMLLVVRSKI